MHSSISFRMGLAFLLALGSLMSTTSVQAQETTDQVVRAGRSTTLVVPVYKSRVVELPTPAKRVSIGNPDIADVLILGSNDLYILGKDLGTTNLLLWDRNDTLVSAISVTITHDTD